LWYDVWHPDGYLFDEYGYQILYDADRSIGPWVSSIIREGEWFWPRARFDQLVQIQSRLFEVSIGEEDLSVWKGKYLYAQTWELLQTKLPKVGWHKAV
jgi:hypothetical protein